MKISELTKGMAVDQPTFKPFPLTWIDITWTMTWTQSTAWSTATWPVWNTLAIVPLQKSFSHTYRNANIDIFVFTASKEKKSSDKMLPPVGARASHNLWFQVQHYAFYTKLTCAPLDLWTWGNWEDLAIINGALLYKDPKVSVLLANAKLVQKG